MLCLAALVSGVYNHSGGFYQPRAADLASPGNGEGISLVLAGGKSAVYRASSARIC
jgi:hypothetical protein